MKFKIKDDGIGIFNKIQKELNLEDPKHSILELAKGKFTSDLENHTGEGIFFSSRMFDSLVIISRELSFVGNTGSRDWLFEDSNSDIRGTAVFMEISKTSEKDLVSIFNEYADPDKVPGFHRTVIPPIKTYSVSSFRTTFLKDLQQYVVLLLLTVIRYFVF